MHANHVRRKPVGMDFELKNFPLYGSQSSAVYKTYHILGIPNDMTSFVSYSSEVELFLNQNIFRILTIIN